MQINSICVCICKCLTHKSTGNHINIIVVVGLCYDTHNHVDDVVYSAHLRWAGVVCSGEVLSVAHICGNDRESGVLRRRKFKEMIVCPNTIAIHFSSKSSHFVFSCVTRLLTIGMSTPHCCLLWSPTYIGKGCLSFYIVHSLCVSNQEKSLCASILYTSENVMQCTWKTWSSICTVPPGQVRWPQRTLWWHVVVPHWQPLGSRHMAPCSRSQGGHPWSPLCTYSHDNGSLCRQMHVNVFIHGYL